MEKGFLPFPLDSLWSPHAGSGGKHACCRYLHEESHVSLHLSLPQSGFSPELCRSLFFKLQLHFLWSRSQSILAVWDSSGTLSRVVWARVEDKPADWSQKSGGQQPWLFCWAACAPGLGTGAEDESVFLKLWISLGYGPVLRYIGCNQRLLAPL